MAPSKHTPPLRIAYLEADQRGVLAISNNGTMDYVCGKVGRTALDENLADGDFQKLQTDNNTECYLREGEELPLHIRPHIIDTPSL